MTHRPDRRSLAIRARTAAAAAGLGIVLATTAPGALAAAAPTHVTKIDAAFLEKVNASCARLAKAVNANGNFPFANFNPLHPKRSELPKVGAFFARDLPAARAFAKQLAALGMPKKGATTWRGVRSLALHYNTVAIAQAKAAQRADVTAFVATVTSLTTTGRKLTAAAVTAGFSRTSACGQIF